ncbi:MAG: Hsp70 family protein [Bacillota bacterium]
MTKSVSRYIGIDFGTSTSVVSYHDYADDGSTSEIEPRNVLFDMTRPTVPTLILTDPQGITYFGYEAERKGNRYPDRLIANFKMDMVSADPAKRKRARELTEQFFRFLHETYESQKVIPKGAEITREVTFVSYPAKWPDQVRQDTMAAARAAGFANVHGMDEPTAAMQYFLTIDTDKTLKMTRDNVIRAGQPLVLLLIDMGAGTTDLVLHRYIPGEETSHTVLMTWPPVDHPGTFGGREVDQRLAQMLHDYLSQSLSVPFSSGKYEWLRANAQLWKRDYVSPELNGERRIDSLPSFLTAYEDLLLPDAKLFTLDRSTLGSALSDYLPIFPKLISELVNAAVTAGKIQSAEEIDLVVLTGGHSQWYFAREILLGKWVPGLSSDPSVGQRVDLPKIRREPERILELPYPQETVARGLAMAGAPIKIKTIGANNTWLNIRVGLTGLEPLRIISRDQALPCSNRSYTRHRFYYERYQDIPVHCVPMVGSRLSTARSMDPIPVRFKMPGFYKVIDFLFSKVQDSNVGDLDLYLETEVDANEHFSVLGVMEVSWLPNPEIIPINHDPIDSTERQALMERYKAAQAAFKAAQ